VDRIVITDLDGTLLDAESYSFEPARPALLRLRDENVPLVLCTSKTRAETEWWRERLGVEGSDIVENGGALYVDGRGIELGSPIAELRSALRAASTLASCPVRGFGDMTIQEIAIRCGLPEDQARLAAAREFDEPFVVLDAARAHALEQAIADAGYTCTRGSRFHHILGLNDKAAAVRQLLAHQPGAFSLGLGDALNDTGFLHEVDRAVLMPSPSLEQLRALVPGARVASAAGPSGWNDAVCAFLGQR
jgi:mannosyl-3-phosphoglycerate phosphatase